MRLITLSAVFNRSGSVPYVLVVAERAAHRRPAACRNVVFSKSMRLVISLKPLMPATGMNIIFVQMFVSGQ
jgi:hypothetical protein